MSPCGKGLNALFARTWVLGSHGVQSFFSVRWFVVLSLYLLATVLMAFDPWFGKEKFAYAQGGYVILMSVILVSALCFDWGYLGRSKGGNLALQFLLVLPTTLLLARLVGAPSERLAASNSHLLQQVMSSVKSLAGWVGLLELIPNPIKDIFASPQSAILFLIICFSLTVARNKILRVGLVFTALAFLMAFTLADPVRTPSASFIAGVLVLGFGLALHFHDITPEIQNQNIVDHLRNVTDEAERRCTIRILRRICVDGHLAPRTIDEIVFRCYADQFGVEPNLVRTQIAPQILNRLVSEHGLVEVRALQGRVEVRPTKALTQPHNPWLAVALVPRCVVVGVLALLWWLTPVDLIPDAIPVLGSLDDFFIVSLGGGGVLQTLKALRAQKPVDLLV